LPDGTKLKEMLERDPRTESNKLNNAAGERWAELGPLSLVDINKNAGINFGNQN